MTARRFLRPRELVPVDDEIWVFDEFHPVAAVLDRASGALRRMVAWPEVGLYQSKLVAGDGRAIWLQTSPGDRLIRLGPAGVEWDVDVGAVWAGVQHDAPRESSQLLATPAGAWSIPVARDEPDVSRRPDTPPLGEFRLSTLCFTSTAGTPHAVPVDGRAEWAGLSGDAAYLRAAVAPSGRRDDLELQIARDPDIVIPGHIPRWRMTYRSVWLHLPDDGGAVDRLTPRNHAVGTPHLPFDDRTTGGLGWRNPWYQQAGRWRENVAGVEWKWGWRPPRDEGIWGRHVWATGRDAQTREVRRRLDLGAGQVIAAVNDGASLWLSIQRRSAPPLDYPCELLRIDGATGDLHTVIGAFGIDIDGLGWPLAARPVDADAHAVRERDRVAGAVWPAGPYRGLDNPSEGISEVSVDLVDRWPDAAVLVSFRHRRWPGLLLRRRLPVFDQLGRPAPVDLDLVGWRLDEWLEAGLAPPPRDAADGVLEL